MRVAKPSLPWSELHRRLDASHRCAERRLTPTRRKAEILHARARSLATDGKKESVISDLFRKLSSSSWGLNTTASNHVISAKSFPDRIYAAACTPAFVLGLINVRDRFLSVINIKKLLTYRKKKVLWTDLNKVILAIPLI